MCDIVFEKAKGRCGTVKRTNVFAEFFQKDIMINLKLTRKHQCWNLFLIKLNSVNLQLQ